MSEVTVGDLKAELALELEERRQEILRLRMECSKAEAENQRLCKALQEIQHKTSDTWAETAAKMALLGS